MCQGLKTEGLRSNIQLFLRSSSLGAWPEGDTPVGECQQGVCDTAGPTPRPEEYEKIGNHHRILRRSRGFTRMRNFTVGVSQSHAEWLPDAMQDRRFKHIPLVSY